MTEILAMSPKDSLSGGENSASATEGSATKVSVPVAEGSAATSAESAIKARTLELAEWVIKSYNELNDLHSKEQDELSDGAEDTPQMQGLEKKLIAKADELEKLARINPQVRNLKNYPLERDE